jgi:hypothetical protein
MAFIPLRDLLSIWHFKLIRLIGSRALSGVFSFFLESIAFIHSVPNVSKFLYKFTNFLKKNFLDELQVFFLNYPLNFRVMLCLFMISTAI